MDFLVDRHMLELLLDNNLLMTCANSIDAGEMMHLNAAFLVQDGLVHPHSSLNNLCGLFLISSFAAFIANGVTMPRGAPYLAPSGHGEVQQTPMLDLMPDTLVGHPEQP